MPIKLPKAIPAYKILKEKNVFVINADRAKRQDIRPLKIGILNLMPEKEITETQIFRMIGSSPLQIETVLIKTDSYTPKNVSSSHLKKFYVSFDHVKKEGLDGLIVTGAPVEHLDFEKVKYWKEFTKILDWSYKHVSSTLLLCWGAQAGLYHFYNIQKHLQENKVFGVFKHTHRNNCDFILRGLDDEFYAPHSYNSLIKKSSVNRNKDLEILSETEDEKLYLVANKDRSLIFLFGHPEYDRKRLSYEYFRDKKKGRDIQIPKNYFPDNDPTKKPKLIWRANAETFYRNWINFIYQTTSYNLKECTMNKKERSLNTFTNKI